MRGSLATLVFGILTLPVWSQVPSPMSNIPAAPVPTVEPLAMTTIRFDPSQLALRRSEGRWHLVAGKQFLKDFGPMDREGNEALRLIRGLHFTQYGTIPGSTPPFEFWLGEDGDGQKGGLTVKNLISFNAAKLKVEQTVGAWFIRDDKHLLYNFGTDEAAARQAFAIMKKHGFNQLGIIGIPRPVMTYLTIDPYARVNQPEAKVDPREAIGALSQQGLMLPNVGYVGGRLPIESRRLEVVKQQSEWMVVSGRDVLGRFGLQETRARDALRLLQDTRVTELVLVGKSGFPFYLSNGRAPHSAVLGFNTTRLNPAQMRVQSINGGYCITEGVRTVFSFADNRNDAELVLKVIQHFQFDQVVVLGDPERGGLRLFSRSK